MSDLEKFLERKKNPVLELLFLEELERIKQKRVVRPPVKPELKVLPRKILPPVITPFRSPLQDKILEPGQQDTVYVYEILKGNIGYIQFIGNNSFDNAYLIWTIDGKNVLKLNVTWDIGAINAPKPITPWLPVEDEVRFLGVNNSSQRVHFHVLCDGFYTDIGNVERLLGMGLPLGEF